MRLSNVFGGAGILVRDAFAAMILTGAVLVAHAQASASGGPARIALIIANAEYVTPSDRLTGSLRDSRAVEKALTSVGFKVHVAKNLTGAELKAAVDRFAVALRQAGAASVGFLYYAGHGGADRSGMNNYLVPVDVPQLANADLAKVGYRVEDVLDRLRQLDTRPAIAVVIDACRNVQAGASARLAPPVEQDKGFLLAHSTQQGGLSDDSSGTYAAALAKYITTPGLTLDAVFENVRREVVAINGAQNPKHSSNVVEKVCLAGCVDPTGAKGKYASNPQLLNTVRADVTRLMAELVQMRAPQVCASGYRAVSTLDISAKEAFERGDLDTAGGTWEQVAQRAAMIAHEVARRPNSDSRQQQVDQMRQMLGATALVAERSAQRDHARLLRTYERQYLPRAERLTQAPRHSETLAEMRRLQAEARQLATAESWLSANAKLTDAANMAVELEESIAGLHPREIKRLPRESRSPTETPEIASLMTMLSGAQTVPDMPGSHCR